MKHKAILYTCVGLMGTAAITGFVDYTHASKAGLFEGLYAEETPVVNAVLTTKELEMEDYSRAAFEYQPAEEMQDNSKKIARRHHRKNDVPPPPPPVPAPPALIEEIAPPPPPPAPAAVVAPDAPPPPPPAPSSEPGTITVPADAPPPPEVKEVKEISTKSFSRAPFPKKKVNRSSKSQ